MTNIIDDVIISQKRIVIRRVQMEGITKCVLDLSLLNGHLSQEWAGRFISLALRPKKLRQQVHIILDMNNCLKARNCIVLLHLSPQEFLYLFQSARIAYVG